MRTWENYKDHVRAINEEDRRNMEEIEEIAILFLPSSSEGRNWASASAPLQNGAAFLYPRSLALKRSKQCPNSIRSSSLHAPST